METSPVSSKPVSGVAKRACDECRTRKTRCDRAAPCSTCRAAGLICRTTTQRSKEQKDRVHVTKQYETKIDRIENRLASIEHLLLHKSQSTLSSPSLPSPAPSLPPQQQLRQPQAPLADTEHSRIVTSSAPQDDHFQSTGNVGLDTESIAATHTFEQTFNRDLSVQQNQQLISALEALRSIVKLTQTDIPGPLPRSTVSSLTKSASEVAPPDWKQVKALLEKIEGQRPMSFNWLSPAALANFTRSCHLIYEHGQEGSPTERLLVYSTLTNACSEYSTVGGGKAADYSYNLARSFSALFLQTLDSFPMLTTPSADTIEALLCAAFTTVGLCKPSLSWTLSSSAARMCQALGYNRLSHVDPKSEPMFNRKVLIFWCVYCMDRSISLRLGRAPSIQDYDVDTPMLAANEEMPPATVALMDYRREIARVQGKISTELYGPAAASLAPDERARIAQAFVDELEMILQRKFQCKPAVQRLFSPHKGNSGAEVMMHGDELLHYCNLTIALCAIPPNHPRRHRALEPARECLRVTRDIRHMYSHNIYAWTFYCHWVILSMPLTPFTAIFGNIIANPNSSLRDLQLLKDFVDSLDLARKLSEGIERYYQLCNTFLNVAQAYVHAKTQYHSLTAAADDWQTTTTATPEVSVQRIEPVISEFDEHFSALGFLNPNVSFETDGNHASNDDMDASDPHRELNYLSTGSLLDWYSGSVSLHALLEQDLDEINQRNFM